MICHEFKGGIGTASRMLEQSQGGHTVGVLCQCNHGRRRDLTIAGVAVGREIPELMPCYDADAPPKREWLRDALPKCGEAVDPIHRRVAARSSSSSRPMRPFCRTSSNGSRGARRWGWRSSAAAATTTPAT